MSNLLKEISVESRTELMNLVVNEEIEKLKDLKERQTSKLHFRTDLLKGF